ncbi:MAG: T9SS type A sorting domain-containing protein, partial [Elusimicrobiota bacterium]|nr:T9SS type A sorting domain-containing protein [Elusimicrobiota bacterium]
VIAVFNLDMIGYWKSGLPRNLDVITNTKSNWLSNFLYQIATRYSLMTLNITVDDGAWWGDHSSFWDNGFYALHLSEAFNWYSSDFNPYYHTTNDTVDKLDMNFAVDITKVAFALLSQLANPASAEEIVILEPDGLNDTISQGEKYTIRWENRTNSPVKIFYDVDTDGEGGTEIDHLSAAVDSYLWDTSSVSPGKYYIYLSTSPGIYKCSSGPVTLLSSVPRVKVYPNPFRPSEGHRQIVFSNLMIDNEIRIYNLAGEVVKNVSVTGSFEWPWDVRNDSNETIASGIYFFTVTGKDGSCYGKIAIIK